MARGLGVEEAIERAKRAQDVRIDAIRALAEARQGVADVRENGERELAQLREQIAQRISAAESADLKAHRAAISAGWTPKDLREIGFSEPDKTRTSRRRPRRGVAAPTTDASDAGAAPATATTVADVTAIGA